MMKRIIGISSLTADPLGNATFYLDAASQLVMNKGSRRATRTPTLDGNAVVYDAGYSESDRTLQIAVRSTTSFISGWFARMVQTYNLVRVTTDEGVFLSVPYRWYEDKRLAWLEVLIMEKET